MRCLVMILFALIASACATTPARVDVFEGQSLLASRPGVVDYYFLGLGAHTDEAVFENEARLARARFRERFGTASRELLLINAKGRENTPASLRHLRHAIKQLGEVMGEEDVLIFYLSSHGHKRRIDLKRLRRVQRLRPGALRVYLDDAGINRRIMILSACFSGSFIPDLEGDNALVVTAASAERPSFGCKPGRELTFFGRAFLRDAWRSTRSLREIFDDAATRIRTWEEREGLRHSDPQYVQGAGVDEFLELQAEGS